MFDQLCTEFIWNGKKSKIPLKTMQLRKENGGANLVNMKIKDLSLKVTWVKKMKTDEKCAELAKFLLCPDLGSDIFRCSLSEHDTHRLFTSSKFWSDVLYAWCQYNYNPNALVEKQMVWWNSRIRIEDSPFLFKHAYNRGLLWISQLYPHGLLLSVRAAFQQYGLKLMEFHAIVSAIPREWKEALRTNGSRRTDHSVLFDTIDSVDNFSRLVYQKLNSDVNMKAIDKWSDSFQRDFGNDEARKLFKITYVVTNVPKFRSFQYRLMNYALILNTHLFRWGMLRSNECSFCANEKETIIHLFWLCPLVQNMWSKIKHELFIDYNEDENPLTFENVFFNCVSRSVHINNFICLLFKQYVYRQRCLGRNLNFTDFNVYVKEIEYMEKYIATKNNSLGKHQRKWR